MKKVYETPVSLSVEMNTENMIAASGVSVGISNEEVDASNAYSNGKHPIWGESESIW